MKRPHVRHGLRSHKLYDRWYSMVKRCIDPKDDQYKHYGGRGITVCERWLDLKNYIEDVEPLYQEGLQLDRIDNDKGYSPDNCRWATRSQNTKNRRNKSDFQSNHEFIIFHKRRNKWLINQAFDTEQEALTFAEYGNMSKEQVLI